MPWINSKIYVADIQMHAKGYPAISHLDAIPSPDMSASFQPQFCPKGNFVYFIRDDSQWGQLFRYNLQTKSVEKITDIQGECAQPNWVHDMRTYTLSHDGTQAFVVANKNTIHTIYQINLEKENESTHYQCTRWTNTHLWSEILQPTCSYDGRHLAFIGSAPDRPPEICLANLKENNAIQPLKSTIKSYPQFIDHQSNPIHLNWQDNGIKTYGLYWPPKSQPICKNGEKDIPPVIFKIHGGPTAQATTCWEPEAQFFTSKNIGVFYVNYRGSWGYGRKYMEAIKGQWGVCDVEDAISGLNYLERQGLASRKKSVIMGGSAGGYTVLQALCHYPQVFAAGICLYGVTDLFALSQQTHKFEKHYNDYLLGILPQATNVYTERSPINFADKIQKPIAIYQGKEDTVVAPQQMISFVDSLKKFNIPHFFHLYENEGHGFRLQETKEHLYRTMTDFIYNSIASDV
ncbi:MAG: prolyl oligopeptidase family serine peptidase [Bdellovibrionota bacterium]